MNNTKRMFRRLHLHSEPPLIVHRPISIILTFKSHSAFISYGSRNCVEAIAKVATNNCMERTCSRNRKLAASVPGINVTMHRLVWNVSAGNPSFSAATSDLSLVHGHLDRSLCVSVLMWTAIIPRLIGCLQAVVRGALLLKQLSRLSSSSSSC